MINPGTIKRMDTAEGAVLLHVQHLRRRNCRDQTIYNRRCALGRLSRWAEGPILYLSEEQLERWQDARVEQITPAARRSELSHAREFYRWAVRERLLRDDPTMRLEMPRAPRGVPRPMAEADVARAIAGADPRMAALLGLAAFAGLRACEIARLDFSEVDFGSQTPMIRVVDGKGGHGRLVPMAPALVAMLRDLSHSRGPVVRRLDGRPGHSLPHNISARANEYLHAQGITATLHQLRHRFGTATYRACQDIRAVQELMGHASPTTTAGYASASPTVSLAAVIAASHLAA